jgi:hypothetical protein
MKSKQNFVKKPVTISEEVRLELSFKLSKRIWVLFRKLNMSPKAFLIESRFNERKFYRLFLKNVNPTFHTLCELAVALKVEPMELFNFDAHEEEEYPTEEEVHAAMLGIMPEALEDDDY